MNESDVLGSRRAIFAWLWLLIAMVFGMVVVGGVTRLTGSGLSIVEWAPILGTLPPLNHADWMAAFGKYQQYPQYRITHPDMTLAEFQGIFFWEYVHRLLGRLVGGECRAEGQGWVGVEPQGDGLGGMFGAGE